MKLWRSCHLVKTPWRESLPPACQRLVWMVFVVFLLLYLGGGRFFIDNTDGETMYRTTQALAKGRLYLQESPYGGPTPPRGLQGRAYSQHGIGVSVVGLPLYYLGKAVESIDTRMPSGLLTRGCWLLQFPVVSAALVALLAWFCLRLGYTCTRSLAAAAVLGLATMLWPYSKYCFSEPLSALLVLLVVYHSYALLAGQDLIHASWAGIALGGAVLTRHFNLLLIPVLGVILILLLPWKRVGPAMWRGLVWVLPAVVLWGAYNGARFGLPWITGGEAVERFFDTPLLVGLYGLLLSPGRGLVWYNLVVLAALPGLIVLWRERQPLGVLILSVVLLHILGYATLTCWSGAWCWGPRFLVPVLPLLLLALPASLEWRCYQRRPKLWRSLFLAVLVLSIVVQLLGVSVFYMYYLDNLQGAGLEVEETFCAWKYSPILAHAWLLGELHWHRLHLSELTASSLRAPSEAIKRDIRATLDLWAVYAYRVGVPLPLLGVLVVLLIGSLSVAGWKLMQAAYQGTHTGKDAPRGDR